VKVEFDSHVREIIVEDRLVSDVFRLQHFKSPDAPAPIIQQNVVVDLLCQLGQLLFDIIVNRNTTDRQVRMLVAQILSQKVPDLRFAHQVLWVKRDAFIVGVDVVESNFIEVVREVESPWLPAAIFIVDEHDFSRVSSHRQDVVLVRVTVGKNNCVTVHEALEELLVAREQKVTVYRVDHSQQLRVWNAIVLEKLASKGG